MSAKNPAVTIGVKACDSQGKVCSKMVYADSAVALTPPTFSDDQITLVYLKTCETTLLVHYSEFMFYFRTFADSVNEAWKQGQNREALNNIHQMVDTLAHDKDNNGFPKYGKVVCVLLLKGIIKVNQMETLSISQVSFLAGLFFQMSKNVCVHTC